VGHGCIGCVALRVLNRTPQSRGDVAGSDSPAPGERERVLVGHDLRHAVLLELTLDPGDEVGAGKRVELDPPVAQERDLLGGGAILPQVRREIGPVHYILGLEPAVLDIRQPEPEVDHLDPIAERIAPGVAPQRSNDAEP
jgi:hypothetical protein